MGDPQPLEIVFHVALADLSAGSWEGNAVLVTMFLCSMTCRIRICCQGTHWGCGREEKERKQVFPLQTDCSSSSSKRQEWWGQRIESTSSWINAGCAGSIASSESRKLWLNCGFSPCRTMLVFIRCSLGMGILNVQQNKIFKNTVIPVGRDEGAIPWLSVLEGLAAACKIGWFGSMFQVTQDLEKGGRDFNFPF